MSAAAAPDLRSRALGSLLGLAVGDALGVPVEFQPRAALKKRPVVDMIGHGSHNQPAGTWSDDSSMAFCVAESLLESGSPAPFAFDPEDMAERFRRWLFENHWTPHGRVFDAGIATREALFSFAGGQRPATSCGGADERSNGNGSLMRLAPFGVWLAASTGEAPATPERVVELAGEFSAITHRHPRSQLCCAYACFFVYGLIDGISVRDAAARATSALDPMVPASERPHMARLLDLSILDAPEETVSGSGYVVHSLEAALWCLEQGGSWSDIALRAVNLGDDTDTTGAIAGAFAGVMLGAEAIPRRWIDALARRDDVMSLAEAFADRVAAGAAA